MKISTRLLANSALPLVLGAVVTILLGINFYQLRALQQTDRLSREIVQSAADLSLLTREIALPPHRQRAARQWRIRYQTIVVQLARLEFESSPARNALERLRDRMAELPSLFESLLRATEVVAPVKDNEKKDRLIGEILLRNRNILTDAQQLGSFSIQHVESAFLSFFIAVLSLIAVATLLLGGLAYRSNHKIIDAIARLRRGTETVAAGRLDHHIDLATDDELGDLACAFDLMTERLRATMASRAELDQEMERRERIEAKLRESEALFRGYFERGLIGMAVTSPEKGWIEVNEQLCQMLGYPPVELKTLTWADLTHPDDLAPDVAHFTQLLAGEIDGYFLDKRFIRKDGRIVHTTLSVSAARNPDGSLHHVIASLLDISERKQAEAELERSNQELQQFAYVASHDLQEPLRMVTSYLQLLQRRYQGRLDADADEFIGYAVDGAQRMKTLILDLLTYSRVGSRSQPFVPVAMEAVLADTLNNLQEAVRESGGQVHHDPLPEVRADAGQMRQLLQNLIGNALKFHGETPPQVHVSAAPDPDGWRFAVRDNGIGIDPRFFERIFVVFQRLHTRDEYSGTGIGLAVCKKIVERHGGRIWVESAPNQGAAFCFTLPAAG